MAEPIYTDELIAPVTKLVLLNLSNLATEIDVYIKLIAWVAALATMSITVEIAGFLVPAMQSTRQHAVHTEKKSVVHLASFLSILR